MHIVLLIRPNSTLQKVQKIRTNFEISKNLGFGLTIQVNGIINMRVTLTDSVNFDHCQRKITITIQESGHNCFYPHQNLVSFNKNYTSKISLVILDHISGYCGRLCLLIQGQLTDPLLNFLFTKTKTICETIKVIF